MSTMRVTTLKNESSTVDQIVLNADGSFGGELNDALGSKPTKTFGTAAPGSPTDGDIWYDTNATPPESKFWDGSAWQNFSAGAANFSDAATGTYTDSGISYKYITYTASGTLTVTKAGFADVLVVGGGGGGGNNTGGGGGGGGHLYVTGSYLPAGSLTVTVGAGGSVNFSAAGAGYVGNNGIASRIDSYIAPGGGGGSARTRSSGTGSPVQAFFGLNGGSGGGGGVVAGAGISGIGNDGGTGEAAGGGGAGAAGSNGTASVGGAGGAGAANSITGSSVTRAGGGGGGGTTGGAGGSGGGGAGVSTGTPNDGTANTGGGGGGKDQSTTIAGAGGSGVVIIRVRTN